MCDAEAGLASRPGWARLGSGNKLRALDAKASRSMWRPDGRRVVRRRRGVQQNGYFVPYFCMIVMYVLRPQDYLQVIFIPYSLTISN